MSLRENWLELESLNEEIASYEIRVTSATNHTRYGAMLRKNLNPVATLEIPNKLFHLWAEKRSLQEKLCTSVSKHYELVNQSIFGGIVDAKDELNLRLQKETSRFKNKIKKLRGEAKLELENGKTNMLVYENEIYLVIIDREEEIENIPPENKTSGNKPESAEFKLKGMFNFLKLPYS